MHIFLLSKLGLIFKKEMWILRPPGQCGVAVWQRRCPELAQPWSWVGVRVRKEQASMPQIVTVQGLQTQMKRG